MKDRLPESLEGADRVFCYAAALGWDARAVLAPLGARAAVFDEIDTMVAAIVAAAGEGDSILVMSNGGFGGIHDKLLVALAS